MPIAQQTFPLRKQTHPDGRVDIFRYAYEHRFDKDFTDLQIELSMMLKYEYGAIPGGEHTGREHTKRAMCLIDPQFSKGWNPWNDMMLDLFTKDDQERLFRTIWGPAHCGKSYFAGLFHYTWWLSDPMGKGVLLYCAKITDAMSRIFTYMLEVHERVKRTDFFDFDIVHSKSSNTEFRSIGLFPVPDGLLAGREDLSKRGGIKLMAIKDEHGTYGDNLIGWHPPRGFRAAGDEQQEIKDRLMYDSKAVSNWSTNINSKLNGWGNPSAEGAATFDDLLSYLGKFDEKNPPNPNHSQEWENRHGHVLHLSHLDNPLDNPKYADLIDTDPYGVKRHRWHFLQGKLLARRVELQSEKSGGKNSRAYWSQVLGFPKPQGVDATDRVLTWEDVKRYGADQPAPFDQSKPIKWFFGSDPSTREDGTECIIFGAKYGTLPNGNMAIDFLQGKHMYVVSYKRLNHEPEDYVSQIKFVANKYGVKPEHFFIETWGTCRVLGHELRKTWSKDWREIRPTGVVSNRLTTPDSAYPAKKEYGSPITEYHFAVKGLLMAGQLYGFPKELARQYENRIVEISAKSNKKLLKSKTSGEKPQKASVEKLTDRMDSVAILCEGLRRYEELELDTRQINNNSTKEPNPKQTRNPTPQIQITREQLMLDINHYLSEI